MSKVSGLSSRTFPIFVKNRFGEERCEQWLNSLPQDVKEVFSNSLIGLDVQTNRPYR